MSIDATLVFAKVQAPASGRRQAASSAPVVLAVTSGTVPRGRVDAGAPGFGCGPCMSWVTARLASPALSASAR